MSPQERQAFGRGARAGALSLALALSAAVPSRWVLAGPNEELPRWQALLLGLAADAVVLCLPAALGAALLLLCRPGRRLAQIGLAGAALLLWLFMVTTTESSLSRGVFPSWADLWIAWHSPATVDGSWDMFLLRRNVIPVAVMMLPAAALLGGWPRRRRGRDRRAEAAGALLAGAGLWLGVSCPAWLGARPLATPLGLFAPSAWPEAAACALGRCEPRVLLAEHETSPELQARGAALLGWPSPRCGSPEPFVRPWPAVEAEGPRRPAAAAVLSRLGELSEVLFSAGEAPLHVFQIVLEGVRGDDLHGINPAAPPAAAPFLAELYEQADRGEAVIASRRTWTAGLRTPHGLAALLCGLGTLPYGLTLSRDLPAAPLRCLPDVLAEAGFAAGWAYGGAPGCDGLDAFLARHSVAPRVTAATLPPTVARGAWGAADRAVFSAAARLGAEGRSSYSLVLSLSHHHPFTPPEDTPAAVRERADQAFAQATERATREDRQRLLTLAYTDDALRELLATLREAGGRWPSLVVISADHPLPDQRLWRHRPGALSRLQARGLVPFVLWLSPQLLDAASDPGRARRLVGEINGALRTVPLSQNDIPTLLLALLAQSPPLRALDPARAWHSLGGQATSPHYVSPGPATARIHGIHAATALYFADAAGRRAAPDEPATLVVTAAQAEHVTPSLRPAGAALRRLLRPSEPCPGSDSSHAGVPR